MSGDGFINIPATRERLDAVLGSAPPHLKPIIKAVRDDRVGMLFVAQGDGAFRMPLGARPAITIIGDDLEEAHGPEGFHLPSIRRAIRASTLFAVISSAPPTEIYEAMAFAVSGTRGNVLIVETRPEQERAWLNLIRKLQPSAFISLATVKGAKA